MALSKTINVLKSSARFRNFRIKYVGDGNVSVDMEFKFQPRRGVTRLGVYDGNDTYSYTLQFAFRNATEEIADWTIHYESFDVQMLGYSEYQTFSKVLNIGYILDISRIEEKSFFSKVIFKHNTSDSGIDNIWESIVNVNYSDSYFTVNYQPELDTSIDGEDGMFDMIYHDSFGYKQSSCISS